MDRQEELVKLFNEIRDRGWIETTRHGDQCLGNAFEDLIGKKEDNKSVADFYDIELKSHRTMTQSMVSLFSKSPSYPKGVNTYLRETYGSVDEQFGKKVLNTTVSGLKENTHKGGHSFKLVVNREEERIYLQIRNLTTNEIVKDDIYWGFNVLQTALEKKLKKIAILYGDEKDENGKHYVRYTSMKILQGLTLDNMLSCIENGELYIDIRIGVYASGKNIGKTHDHGSAFRIHLYNLLKYGIIVIY